MCLDNCNYITALREWNPNDKKQDWKKKAKDGIHWETYYGRYGQGKVYCYYGKYFDKNLKILSYNSGLENSSKSIERLTTERRDNFLHF